MKLLFTAPYTSWTHRLTRQCVRPLVGTRVTPNHLTTLRVMFGFAGCVLYAIGSRQGDLWGGVCWVLSCLLDRADGELARMSGKSSRFGHLYDYYSDVAINGLFFAAIGVGARAGFLGWSAILLGILAAATIIVASIWSEQLERVSTTGNKAYMGVFGFDFDDILYLFAPIGWLSWTPFLLIGGALGGPVFAMLTYMRLYRLRKLRSAS